MSSTRQSEAFARCCLFEIKLVEIDGVDVEWETVQRSTYSNSLYFTAKDAKGHSSKPGLLPDETMLKARKLAEGEKESGSLAFDVAKGPVTLVIIDASQHELAHIKIPA